MDLEDSKCFHCSWLWEGGKMEGGAEKGKEREGEGEKEGRGRKRREGKREGRREKDKRPMETNCAGMRRELREP